MFEKLMSVNPTNLKWALVVIGINSFFVSGALRLILNIAIFLLALWTLIILQRQGSKSRAPKEE